MIEALLFFIFYQYEKIEEAHLRENLTLAMKNYNYAFDDSRFDIDIVPMKKGRTPYELYSDEHTLYMLIPLPTSPEDSLKIFYPRRDYERELSHLHTKMRWQFLFVSLLALIISVVFSLYTLSPLRNALVLLETFIKDIIHDLNTPVSNILLNLKMMDRESEEVESIRQSTHAISMLHHNLNAYLEREKHRYERFSLREVVEEQVAFFAPMYHYLSWQVKIEDRVLYTDRLALSRILYNLLSNACRYNTAEGFVAITTTQTHLTITNSSDGIKAPERVFERFYKEGERGLGIGLHIVQSLSQALEIDTRLSLDGTIVSVTLDLTYTVSSR